MGGYAAANAGRARQGKARQRGSGRAEVEVCGCMGRSKTRFRAVLGICWGSERRPTLNSMGPSFSTKPSRSVARQKSGGMSSGVGWVDSASMSNGHDRRGIDCYSEIDYYYGEPAEDEARGERMSEPVRE